MRLTIITFLFFFSVSVSAQTKPQVDSTQFVKLLSLRDIWQITQSLKDKMTVTEWEKVTQAIDQVYLKRREEYLKSKDTAKTK